MHNLEAIRTAWAVMPGILQAFCLLGVEALIIGTLALLYNGIGYLLASRRLRRAVEHAVRTAQELQDLEQKRAQ